MYRDGKTMAFLKVKHPGLPPFYYSLKYSYCYTSLRAGSKTLWNLSLRTRRVSLIRLILILLAGLTFLKQSFTYFPFSSDFHVELFKSSEYRNLAAHRLSGAVKIPTITYDDMGLLGEDHRWDIFYTMAAYLEAVFPRL
jgi:hypothetical protein